MSNVSTDLLGDDAPRDSHWHFTMERQRLFGICDIRALASIVICFIKIFSLWWLLHIKLPLVGVTVGFFMYIEARDMTPEIALRKFIAWLRGPETPAIASISDHPFGFVPIPRSPRGFAAPVQQTVAVKRTSSPGRRAA